MESEDQDRVMALARHVGFWELDRQEREALLFMRRLARVRGSRAVHWEEDIVPAIRWCIDRHLRQRELFAEGQIDFDPDTDPPMFAGSEDSQRAFLDAFRRLRDKGLILEHVIRGFQGLTICYSLA